MKKLMMCLCLLFCMIGCSKDKGSFQEGTFDDTLWIQDVNEAINDQKWDMVLLNDESVSEDELYRMYQLKSEDVKSYAVHTAVIASTPVEIAVFQSDDTSKMQTAVDFHINSLKEEYASMPECVSLIDQYSTQQIDDYYILIISHDAQGIMDYLTS